MKKNIREYQSIKFFRGRKRNNAEMLRLSEAGLDFEYRRLLIEENELDLHVAFSKMIVWKITAWCLLALSVIFFRFEILFFVLIFLSIISQILSHINKKYFEFIFRGHNLALGFVDAVIQNNYGIIMPR
jgi:hypothetical protein